MAKSHQMPHCPGVHYLMSLELAGRQRLFKILLRDWVTLTMDSW